MKYIKNVETVEDLKKVYKKLAMQMHPDRGGDEEEMKVLNNEYDILFSRLKNIHKNKDGDFYTKENNETPNEWKDILNKLFALYMEKVEIEVIGSFLWLTGNTRPYKDHLKELGFKWSRKKEAWYLPPKDYKRFGKKNFDMNDIREMYGSEKIKNKKKSNKLLTS